MVKMIEINIPNKKCGYCKAIHLDDEKVNEFNDELLEFIENTKFEKHNIICSQCDKEFNYEPINIFWEEACENCGEYRVTENFCEKECAEKFVKDKIKNKIDTNNRKKELIKPEIIRIEKFQK